MGKQEVGCYKGYLESSVELLKQLSKPDDVKVIEIISKLINKRVKEEGTILVGGNGGSCCDADHFATELIVRYKKKRKPAKCITLHNSNSTLTAYSNDYNFTNSYSRVIETFANRGDILLLLSTSGRSNNIINAAKSGKSIGTINIGLFGKDASSILKYCDHKIVIPSSETSLIQQAHICILHYLALKIEEMLIK